MAYQLRSLFALVLICFTATFVVAQDAPAAGKHPRIGLVLQGGGALGLAHVGVIQYLEEHRIPVSYIPGTSIGGLVGGGYATGMNAREVHDTVKEINWKQVIGGRVPFSDLSFRRKQDAHDFPGALEFGLRNGLKFSSGFNSGQGVQLLLDKIALPYSDIKSFNDLPIPFACVATDLVTAEAHVFRAGPLSLALRSTMSLPGLFTPVRSGDHIYVDGGLMDNIPIDVGKEMGADIILAVHLQGPELDPNATLSSFAVLGRSIAVVIEANQKRSMANLRDRDVLINVPLEQFTIMDYNQADAIIQAGYEAAAANADKLAALSVDETTWRQYLEQREARRRKPAVPHFVELTGVPPDVAHPLAEQMSGLAGQPLDLPELDQSIMELNGMGPYSGFSYSMVVKDDKQGLNLEAQPNPYSPPIVRPVILINGASYNNVFFSMGARITFLNFGGFRSELRNDVIVGSEYRLQSEYYRPFAPTSNWFMAPRLGFNSDQYPIYAAIPSWRCTETVWHSVGWISATASGVSPSGA